MTVDGVLTKVSALHSMHFSPKMPNPASQIQDWIESASSEELVVDVSGHGKHPGEFSTGEYDFKGHFSHSTSILPCDFPVHLLTRLSPGLQVVQLPHEPSSLMKKSCSQLLQRTSSVLVQSAVMQFCRNSAPIASFSDFFRQGRHLFGVEPSL